MNYTILWLSIIILCEALALYYIKAYSIDNKTTHLLIFSIVLYAMIPYFLYRILKNQEEISVINVIWNVASTLYGLFIGIILFNEHISLYQKVGIILGTIGTCLMFTK